MNYIILIPGLLCMVAVFRWGTKDAFLKVVLPVLMLLPLNYKLAIPHLPPLSFADTALLSLGIGMLAKDGSRWRFSRMDLPVGLFMFTNVYSLQRPFGINGSFLHLISMFLVCWFPYMAGKLLIEQPGMRVEAVKRLVSLMAIASIFAMPEYLVKVNPYIYFFGRFFPAQWQPTYAVTQIRFGRGRVGGPFGGSEQAGMVLMFGVFLAIWLLYCKSQRPTDVGSPGLPPKRAGLIVLVLLVMIFTVGARGPWIGSVVAIGIASIGRAKRPLRRAILVIGLGLAVGIPAYSAFKEYASGPRTDYGSDRETAQYRTQMYDNYVPLAETGGAFGMGGMIPVIDGQVSIDSEYLNVWLQQGYVGLASLILLFINAFVTLVTLGIQTRSVQERYLIYSQLGILAGMAVCVATVYLDFQGFILLFFVLGWTQAIRPGEAYEPQTQEERVGQGQVQAYAMRVYT
jgi:hypothetical protein